MNTRKMITFLALTCLLTACPADDGNVSDTAVDTGADGEGSTDTVDDATDTGEPGLPPGLGPALEEVMQAAIDQGAPGMSLHVMHPELGTWSGALGEASLDGDPMETSSAARAGSILKIAVATAVLQHVEDGQLALDDTLTDLLEPGITDRLPEPEVIDVAMLLSHRSGIPEWVTPQTQMAIVGDPTHLWTVDEMLDIIADTPASFEPDSAFGYSNTNFNLLGAVLEAVDERTWREVLEQDVFAAAGLEATELPPPGAAQCPSCARGYLDLGSGSLADVTEIDPSMAGAAGGHALVTTPEDLDRLLDAILTGALFDDAETLEAMLDFQPADDPTLDGYGLGMSHSTFDGTGVIGHTGGTAGYQSFCYYVPDLGYYVSGFINTDLGLGFLDVGTAVFDAIESAQ